MNSIARQSNEVPAPMGEGFLRHPYETKVFAVSVSLNLLGIGGAILLAIYAGSIAEYFPTIGKYANEMRVVILAFLAMPITLPFLRNTRVSRIIGNSVRLSEQQLPQIYGILKKHCDKLGIEKLPELYLTDRAISEPSNAFSTFAHKCIVLSTRYIDPDPKNSLDVLSFLVGSELGRLRLGHTGVLDELSLGLVSKVPYLRNPITEIRTYSRDRYAAYLAPDGLAGLLIQAAGRRQRKSINIDDYLKQASTYGGVWAWLVIFQKRESEIASRIRRLLDAGFFPNLELVKKKEND